MRAGKCERTGVRVRIGQLEDHRPVGSRDPAEISMAPGDTVEFLPPFAGG